MMLKAQLAKVQTFIDISYIIIVPLAVRAATNVSKLEELRDLTLAG